MRGAEPGSVEIVVAMAALLARVAFADRRYTQTENERVRLELSHVLGFGDPEIDALCAVLGRDLARSAEAELDRYTDTLRERLDTHMRADVVKVLIELSAADREIADSEVAVVREVAAKLLVDEALLEALLLRARELGRD
jgi:uncharacterized tellurite resistance protein B-like protein